VIGAEEDDLARAGLEPGPVEHLAHRDAGPAAVTRQTVQRPAVARAFEAEHQLAAGQPAQLVERQAQGPIDEPGHAQAIGAAVEGGVSVVLRREELVPRRQRAVDVADVDDAAVRRPLEDNLVGQVGEGYHRLALGQRRERPFGDPEHAEPRQGQAALEHVAPARLCRHVTTSSG
jgi:hypothetical protein